MGGWKDGHTVITSGQTLRWAPTLLCHSPSSRMPDPQSQFQKLGGTSLLISAILGPFPRNKGVHPESGEEPRTRRRVSHPNSATL